MWSMGSFDGTANSQSFSQPVMNYGGKAPAGLGKVFLLCTPVTKLAFFPPETFAE